MERWKVEKKNPFIELLMGILGSGIAVLISLIMMRLAVGQKEDMMMTVGVTACLFGMLILTVFLLQEKEAGPATWKTAGGSVL